MTFDLATAQIKRLTGLRRFPSEPEAAKELIIALQTADNSQIATTVVDDILAMQVDCPVPAQIREAVRVENAKTSPREPAGQWGPKPKLCPICSGWGVVGSVPNARFCTCPDGADVQAHPQLGETYLRRLNAQRASNGGMSQGSCPPRRPAKSQKGPYDKITKITRTRQSATTYAREACVRAAAHPVWQDYRRSRQRDRIE